MFLVGFGFNQGLTHMVHMFNGVHYASNSVGEEDKKSPFLYRHIATASSSGGLVLSWFYAGLNYHIEHHLFPRMSSAWYPYIAPKVREICKKHGVRYAYYPWLLQNMASTLKYTHEVGVGAHWKNNPFKGEM